MVMHNMVMHKRTLHSNGKEIPAYIFIDDLTLGPALGGLRMKHYDSEEEVTFDGKRLAAGMTKKSALAGLPLGGGKAIIVGGPEDKSRQLFHEMGEFVSSVNGRYITAEDVGVNVRDLELVAETSPYVAGVSSSKSGSGDPSPLTAYGVYSGIKTCVESLDDLTVAVQGIGHVGFSLIFGFPILDRKFDKYRKLFPGLINKCGRLVFTDIDPEKIKDVKRRSVGDPQYHHRSVLYHHAHAAFIPHEEIFLAKKDIFSPCALGAGLNNETIPALFESGCKIIAGAANNQLLKPEHGAELQKRGILYIPDYALNAGGVINVWFGLDARNHNKPYDVDASVKKCSEIGSTVKEIVERSRAEKKPTSKIADIMAQEIIEKGKH